MECTSGEEPRGWRPGRALAPEISGTVQSELRRMVFRL